MSEIGRELKLEPNRKKILLMGGTFGFLEYEELVNKISAQFSEPIEIIAVCGKNKAQRARLDRMIRLQGRNVPGGGLPLNVKLRATGLIPQEELIKYLAVHRPPILSTPVLTVGDTVQTHYRRIFSDLFQAVRRFIYRSFAVSIDVPEAGTATACPRRASR